MAYILKSNVVVNDPDNKFTYYSRFGVTSKDVAKYIKSLDATGYEMTQAEFKAFDTFVNNLKDGLVWDKVYEVYPLFGKDLDGALLKLKSFKGDYELEPISGFDTSRLEIVGGKVLGKVATPATNLGNQPRLDTGITVAELLPSVGFHFYAGNAGTTGATYWQALAGTIVGENASASVVEIVIDTHGSFTASGLQSASARTTDGFTNSPSIIGASLIPNIEGVSIKGYHYVNGVKVHDKSINPTYPDLGADATIAVLGRNAPYVSNQTGASTAYSGIVRFGCITSGFLSHEQVALLHNEIDKLLTALGKKV